MSKTPIFDHLINSDFNFDRNFVAPADEQHGNIILNTFEDLTFISSPEAHKVSL